MDGTRRRYARGTWLVGTVALAALVTGCRGTDGGAEGSGPAPRTPAGATRTPAGDATRDQGKDHTKGKDNNKGTSKGKGKGKGEGTGAEKGKGKGKGRTKDSAALTCEQLRSAPLQTDAFRFPDAPAGGTIAFTDGRWEGDGLLVELQPQCGIGDMTGDPAADAVGAVKVTTGGTGRFYGLVTWRNDGGSPVPVAAASLGDRTPVVSIDATGPEPRRATVLYLTRGASDPAAVVTLRRTAVYRVAEPAMVELHHSDAPYTP